ncbi:MAG: anti-sigma factor family protein [Bryobacteraceae bacterium]
MNCAEFEVLLADYLDNTLGAPERAALQQHASSCVGCRDLLNDASGALSFLQRTEEVAVPAELITRIAYQAPAGRVREPFERQGFFSKLISKWLQPVLQPRLVMGMAMTILSFAMLERCTGVRVQQIQAADLNPVRIWGGLEDKTVRLKDRAVKYYENLRWVYEIEVRLGSLQDESETAPEQTKESGGPKTQGKTNGDKR